MRALAIASMLCSVVVGRALKRARQSRVTSLPAPSSDAGIQWTLTEEQVRESLDWWKRAISEEELSFWRRYREASSASHGLGSTTPPPHPQDPAQAPQPYRWSGPYEMASTEVFDPIRFCRTDES